MINLIALAFLLLPNQTVAYEAPPLPPPKTIEQRIEDTFGVGTIMLSVANCESGLRQYDGSGKPIKSNYGTQDYGVFQINQPLHEKTATRLGYNIYTLDGNIAYAKYLYDKNGLRDWSASKPCWSVDNTKYPKLLVL